MGSCCGGSTEVDGWAMGCVGGRTSLEICSPVSVPIISLRPKRIHFVLHSIIEHEHVKLLHLHFYLFVKISKSHTMV